MWRISVNTALDKFGFILGVSLCLFCLYVGVQTLRDKSKVEYKTRGARLWYSFMQLYISVVIGMTAVAFVLPLTLIRSYMYVLSVAGGVLFLLLCFGTNSPKGWFSKLNWMTTLVVGLVLICLGLRGMIL